MADDLVHGATTALVLAPLRADGRTAELRIGPSAHALLTFAARDVYEELLRRLRRRGYDWE